MQPSQLDPKDLLHPIRRVEVQGNLLRVYLTFEGFKRHGGHITFYVVTLDERHDERRVLSGRLPRKSEAFSLTELQSQKQITEGQFDGNRYGGEVTIQINTLPPASKLFIQLGQNSKTLDESPWYTLTPIPHSPKGAIAIIPCYNVAKFCDAVVRETISFVNQVIVIDDGSTDATPAILDRIASEMPDRIHIIHFPENRGKGYALIEGFQYALAHFNFDVLVTLDGDAQHRPSDIPHLVYAVEKGEELVIGSRQFRLMPLSRQIANSIIAHLLRRLYSHAPLDTQSGLRAFSKNLIEEIVRNVNGGRYETEFECLLLALEQHRRIESLVISTLYIDKNISSHFSTLIDSYRILKVLLSHTLNRIARRRSYRRVS